MTQQSPTFADVLDRGSTTSIGPRGDAIKANAVKRFAKIAAVGLGVTLAGVTGLAVVNHTSAERERAETAATLVVQASVIGMAQAARPAPMPALEGLSRLNPDLPELVPGDRRANIAARAAYQTLLHSKNLTPWGPPVKHEDESARRATVSALNLVLTNRETFLRADDAALRSAAVNLGKLAENARKAAIEAQRDTPIFANEIPAQMLQQAQKPSRSGGPSR